MSKETIDYHYGKLAKGYVDRYNNKEGDAEFNEAGAKLHDLFFAQFQTSKSSNQPHGSVNNLINKHFGNFTKFKEEFTQQAMSIQGSGWVYLSSSGKIKTISNHQMRTDIVLIIDWWEHAWVLDYLADKSKYLSNIWKIINWDTINLRV